MDFGGAEGGRRFEPGALNANRFASRLKLGAAEWAEIRGKLQPFEALLG